MPLIPFPNVPQVPGVPAVLRDLTIPSIEELAQIGIAGIADLIFGTPRWGIYDDSDQQVIEFDTFLGIRFRNNTRISTFPVEGGGFSSFNKVDTPFDVAIRVAHSGDMASREGVLAKLEQLKGSVELFSVVTPDIVYESANIVAYSYERTSRTGSSQLVLEIFLEEVRQTAAAAFSETAEPAGAEPVSNGQVQTFPVPDPIVLQSPPLGAPIQ